MQSVHVYSLRGNLDWHEEYFDWIHTAYIHACILLHSPLTL